MASGRKRQEEGEIDGKKTTRRERWTNGKERNREKGKGKEKTGKKRGKVAEGIKWEK